MSKHNRTGRTNSRGRRWRELRLIQLESRALPSSVPLSFMGPFSLDQIALANRSAAFAWTAQSAGPVTVTPTPGSAVHYLPLRLNEPLLRARLTEGLGVISLPRPNGIFERFTISEVATLDPQLSVAFPLIKTYRGRGIDDPTAIVAADMTYAGFHATVLRSGGGYQIQPVTTVSNGEYYSFFDRDLIAPHGRGCQCDLCSTVAGFGGGAGGIPGPESGPPGPEFTNGTQLRTLRLAVAATGEYTAAAGGTVPLGLSAITTVINSVNAVYERDVAVRMTLIANQNAIIYTNSATDPYTGTSASTMLAENQTNLDTVIGTANYDIGHVFGGNNLGGIATVGSAGNNSIKARGVSTTDGSAAPTNAWMTFVVSHEMGHQFNALHTFNGVSAGLDPNRTASTAYEPGSGSTIMGYGGVGGGGQDFVTLGDTYFHGNSLERIINYLNSSIPSVGSKTATGNTIPTINAGADKSIPANTSFALTATINDTDGDSLTVDWEQYDLGPAQALGSPDNGSSPLFRSFPPTASPTRYFPNLTNLLNNTTSITEVMPTTNRPLNFRASVRDNRANGGGVASDDITLTVVKTPTPFKVTSPNTAVSWPGKSTQRVTWDVGGTNLAPINATNVNIVLSTDGGMTWPTTLLASTPNDGDALVVMPDINNVTARIKVEPVGNVFLDVSDVNFFIPTGSPMQVNSITPAKFATVTTPIVNVDVAFTNAVNPVYVDKTDLTLSRGTVTATQVLDAKTVRYTVSGITGEAPLTVTMPAFFVYDTLGNGVGQYIADYSIDVGADPFPTPLAAAAPAGSMIYTGSVNASIYAAGDADTFTLALDPGQQLSIVVTPGGGLQPQVALTGPGGMNVSDSGSAVGKAAALQAIAIDTAGEFTFTISGLSSTIGSYTVAVATNAILELETNGGSSNNTPAGAEATIFHSIGGTAEQAGVAGRADPGGEVEPNNTTGTATAAISTYGAPVVTGGVQRYHFSVKGAMSSGADVDFFNIGKLNAGDFISVTASGLDSSRGTLANPAFTVFQFNSGTPLTFTNQVSNNGPGNDEIIDSAYIFTTDTYYVKVSGNGGSGTYELGLTMRSTIAPSTVGSAYTEAEGNDTFTTANDVSASWRVHQYESLTNGTITSGDVDVFALTFAANDIVTLIAKSQSSLDAKLILRNAGGTIIALDDGTSSTLFSGDALIYGYRISASGTYYAEVAAASFTGAYTLQLDLSGAAPATPPAAPDVYSVTLTAGQILSIGAKGVSGPVLDLSIVDSSSVVLTSASGSPTNVDKGLTYVAPASGTYFIRLMPTQSSDYQVAITRNANFDTESNDSHALAQVLTGERALGAVVASNPDWYQFPVTAGEIIVLSTTTPGDGSGEFVNVFDPTVDLYDPAATYLGTDDNSAADGKNVNFARQAAVTGNYRAQVRSNAGKNGEYVLRRKLLPNQTPNLDPPPVQMPLEGKLFNYTATVANPNPDLPLNFSLISPPSGMTINAATGLVSWTPADNQVVLGCKIRVQVNGIPTLFDEEPFNVTVLNAAPSATFAADATSLLQNSTNVLRFTSPVDAATDTTFGFHYGYDFDNNGTYELGSGTYATASTAAIANVPASFFSKSGTVTLRGRIIDKDNGFTDYTVNVSVAPLPIVGTEFKVHTYTTNAQINPAVASDDAGNFVVVWQSLGQDLSDYGIYAQRFNNAGAAAGSEFRVNTYTTSIQCRPSVAMDSDGDFVIAWQSYAQDVSGYGIFAQRYDKTGATAGAEFRVNTYTTSQQARPDVAMSTGGDFVVCWQDAVQEANGYGIYGQRYTAAGAAVGGEFHVNTFTTSLQTRPSVAMDTDGDFVVAWQSYTQDVSGYGVYARRYNAGIGQSEFQVNTFTTLGQFNPAVAIDLAGDVVIAWTSNGQDGNGYGVYARRFNPASAAVTGEISVNLYTTSSQHRPSVAMDADGDFVVAWASLQDGSGYGVYTRRFNFAGVPQISELQANTFTLSAQTNPAIAIDADGDWVVAWQSVSQDVSGYGIYAQRFLSNFAPTTTGLSPVNVNEDAADTEINLLLSFDDYEGGAAGLTYTVAANSNPSLFAGTSISAGKLTLDYAANANGLATITIRGTDAGGKIVETPMSVTVNAVNDAPLLTPIGNKSVNEASLLSFTVTATDANDSPPNKLTYSLINGPSGASIGANSGLFTWTPTDGPGQTAVFKIRVTDDGSPNQFVEEQITVTVNNVAPTATSVTGPASGNIGQSQMFTVNGGTDVSSVDLSAGLLYSFDFNNDGTFEVIDSASASASFAFSKADTYTVVGRVKDKDGGFKDYTTDITITPAAKISLLNINGGSPQRSRVTTLSVSFDQIVTFAGTPEAAFELKRQADGKLPNVVLNVNNTGPGTVVTITFTGSNAVDNSSLADGRYTLTVFANQVSYLGSPLDGNGDGTPGDDYVQIGTPANGLFRLFGDSDGDGTVAANDFIQFRLALGGNNPTFDFDNDGAVAASDFIQFRLRFGGSV